ncbi:NADPH:adrenodoxin oxidoreductase, mitochondrial [Episyrphus balteatus]|uniref:NADPH:adrenodoxin oxidoreductase, mitochondrial n=1 Tax=Episyrphus balteatus TaxID=286459 RepID=UPI0024867DB9|nr:NADPH:adrenodoxin oxidoreductase, mitochondrial [Episyrphus balteatus]
MFLAKSILKQNQLNTIQRTCNFSLSSISAARKKVCIVGAGPAGFYAAQYILKHLSDCDVDVLEKLPVPFGLVRFGVAPDHPEVKNVINTFTKTAENPRFRFLGNLSLGKDFSIEQLRDNYHAVLLTYGADEDRRMNIPNEDSKNVISARKFVAWYNGLPGSENLNPDLSGDTVTLVGQGNVAIDVARILLSKVDALKSTDTTEYALEALANSKVKNVYLVGRRGPLQAAFTIKELREILKLPDVSTVWRKSDFKDIPEIVSSLARPRKRLTELMLKSLDEQQSSPRTSEKKFLPVFQRSPKEIHDDFIEFSVTELQGNTAIPTDVSEKFQTDLILRSIGYKSVSVDKGINFDDKRGYVVNKDGRVLQKNSQEGSIDKGLYVAGWLGTGPTGVILTTMNGAFGVAKAICDDVEQNFIDTETQKSGLDISDKRVVTWKGWTEIDKYEVEIGKAKGKPREKLIDIEKMLKIAGV